eukprot:11215586-Lingulodinium_polyedra.AAC.1
MSRENTPPMPHGEASVDDCVAGARAGCTREAWREDAVNGAGRLRNRAGQNGPQRGQAWPELWGEAGHKIVET